MTVEPTPLSATNPRLTDLRRLTGRRRSRVESGRFVVEGPVVVAELLAAGASLREVFVDLGTWSAADDRSTVHTLVRNAVEAGVPVWGLESGVVASVADTDSPQGVLATAERRVVDPATVASVSGAVLVLVDVNDPGNAGTLVRAAEAAGAVGVVAAGTTTDLFGPKAVRAAAGSVVRVPIAEHGDVSEVLDALRDAGRRVIASVVAGGATPEAVDLVGPVAILVGSEAHGLAPEVVDRCDATVTIPMASSVESVNVAVAGAVMLFESARQRRHAQGEVDTGSGDGAIDANGDPVTRSDRP